MSDPLNSRWSQRYGQWLDFVQQAVKLLEAGSNIPIGPTDPPLEAPNPPRITTHQAKILIAAPHPDDEALIGALALRSLQEAGARVIDCAITLGSNRRQRSRRVLELQHACRVLGFGLIVPLEDGFSNVTLQNRREHPEEWAAKVNALREIFDREKPDVVFAPHAEDFNTAHIGTHHLVVDALGAHLEGAGRGPLPLIETEFWHQHSAPNLMVGVRPETVALQVMATAEHGGEVSRMPYHLRLPARMIDNVRRGSEVVGGQGAAAQAFPFAELYRVTFMKGRQQIQPRPGGRIVGPDEKMELGSLAAEFRPADL